MRQIIAISAFSAVAIGAWYVYRARSNNATPQSNHQQNVVPGQTSGAGYPLDYLNFDFNKLLSGDSNMKKTETTQGLPVGKPVSKGIANNNPLNIESNSTQWKGKVGDDGRFIVFDSPFWGLRAGARTMKTYRDKRGLNNVQGIVTRWAPPSDNNPTDKYISFVAKQAGVLASQPLGAADYPRVVAAMIHFENGYNPYDEITISNATAEGFA